MSPDVPSQMYLSFLPRTPATPVLKSFSGKPEDAGTILITETELTSLWGIFEVPRERRRISNHIPKYNPYSDLWQVRKQGLERG